MNKTTLGNALFVIGLLVLVIIFIINFTGAITLDKPVRLVLFAIGAILAIVGAFMRRPANR